MPPTMPMTIANFGSSVLYCFYLSCGSWVGILTWLRNLLIKWVTIPCNGPLRNKKPGTSCRIVLIYTTQMLAFTHQTFPRAFGIHGLTFKMSCIYSQIIWQSHVFLSYSFFLSKDAYLSPHCGYHYWNHHLWSCFDYVHHFEKRPSSLPLKS